MTWTTRLTSTVHALDPRFVAVLAGLALVSATPPFDFIPGVFLGLGAFAFVVDRCTRRRDALVAGWLFGTSAGLVGLRFVVPVVHRFTPLGWASAFAALLGLAAAQGLAWGLASAFAVVLRRSFKVPAEAALALATLLASSLPAIIGWSPAALASPWPVLVQSADVVGERGVSALFAAWSALGLRVVRADREPWRARVRPLLAFLGAAALAVLYGIVRMHAVDAESGAVARLALVQAAVEPERRWAPDGAPSILSALRRETAFAENAGVDLTIWPEAAYPYPLRHDTRALPRGQREVVGGAIDGPILFGYLASAPHDGAPPSERYDTFNSAAVVRADRTLSARYDKVQLIPFGETVPFADAIPWLQRTFQRAGGMRAGTAPVRIDVTARDGRALELGVLTCFEDTQSAYGRRLANELTPNLLVNLTNDAWFEGTYAPELHLRLSALRAIELRRDLVRAVNLGPSAWFDAAGRLRAVRRDREPSFLVVTPTLRSGALSWFARLGDAGIAGLVALLALASRFRRQ